MGNADDVRLESWKQIAAYLKRDVRTVQRWERLEGLPVHRDPQRRLGGVFAYPRELDGWREIARSTAPLNGGRQRLWRPLMLATAGLMMLIGMSFWAARAREAPVPPSVNRVWGGPDVGVLGGLSPDGRYVSYIDADTADLAVRELKTGAGRRLTQNGALAASRRFALSSVFSRDSTRIAYARSAEGGILELRIAAVDGSGGDLVFRYPRWHSMRPAGWTAGGGEILCVLSADDGQASLAFIRIADGRLRPIKSFAFGAPLGVSLSPDDRVIVYDAPVDRSSPARDIVAITSDGIHEVRVASHAANDVTPAWTPDGRTIVFVSERGGPSAVWAVTLREMRPSDPWLVKAGVPVTAIVGVSGDGVLYYRTEMPRTDVYTAALDPRSGTVTIPPVPVPDRFVGWNTTSDWSPDGRSLVYRSQRSDGDPRWVLKVLTLAPREEHEFALPAGTAWNPRWSPDSRSILFSAPTKASNGAMYLLDMATGDTRQIVERERPAGGFAPAWSPDGRSIVFTIVEREQQSIVRLDLASRLTEIIYRPGPAEYVGDASVSPDSRVVAFRATSTDNTTSLRLVPFTGGTARELVRFTMPGAVSGPAWTTDGRDLLFVRSQLQTPDRNELWRIDVSTGDMRSTGIVAEGLRAIRVHPDGRRVVFSGTGSQAELWAMRNLPPSVATRR